MQLEAWFESRTDKLQEIARCEADKIIINDFENDNPDFINGFKAGLLAAVEVIGKLPLNVESFKAYNTKIASQQRWNCD